MIKEINEIVKTLDDEVSAINCGGCCVFAESLFPYLESLGLTPRVKVINFSDCNNTEDITILRESVNDVFSIDDWNANGVMFNHVVIEFTYRKRVYIVDSTGVFSDVKFDRYSSMFRGSFSHAETRSFAEDRYSWNSWFDREDIGKIKDNLRKGFNSLFHNQFKLFSDIVYT